MNSWKDYIKDICRYSRSGFIRNILFMIMDGITGGIGVLMLIPLLSLTGVTSQSTLNLPFLNDIFRSLKENSESVQLVAILTIYLTLVILQSLISRQLSVLNTEIVQGYTKYLRDNLYSVLVKTEWSFLAGKKKSDITNTFTNEISRIASGTVFFLRMISQAVIAAVQIGVAFLMSAPLTVFVLLCGAIIFLLMGKTFRESKNLGGSLRMINQELMSQVAEQLNGVKEVKSYGIEEAQQRCFKDTTEKTFRNMRNFTVLQSKSAMYYKIGAAVVISLLFYVSVVFLKIEPTALLIIVYIFARLWPIFTSFQNSIQNVLAMMPSYVSLKAMVEELRSNEEIIKSDHDHAIDKMVSSSIRFEDVSFYYEPSDEFVLKNLNFEIRVKSMTAIVGKSGEGKSTIVDLLLGLLKPTEGQITVDGMPIGQSNMRSWRSRIGYVPQDPFLFNATIRENLLRFVPTATEEEIKEALRLSAAYDFVERLPESIDTIIGDNGVRLSGGERQRIVLARALLRKPEILVLDEATSALDRENEYKIQKAVEQLSEKLTVVVIAHRISTIRNAGKIIVVENGEISEQSIYQELMEMEWKQ